MCSVFWHMVAPSIPSCPPQASLLVYWCHRPQWHRHEFESAPYLKSYQHIFWLDVKLPKEVADLTQQRSGRNNPVVSEFVLSVFCHLFHYFPWVSWWGLLALSEWFIDQFLMQLWTSLENMNQKCCVVSSGSLTRCLWNYVNLLRHICVYKTVRQIFLYTC